MSSVTEPTLRFDALLTPELRELSEDLARIGGIGTVLSLIDGTIVTNYLALDGVVSRPRLVRRIALAYAPYLDSRCERIAVASPLGIALGAALSVELCIPMMIIGPRPDLRIRGNHRVGERVTLLEDQVLTGRSAATSVTALRRAGLAVDDVVTLLHRSERRRTALDEADVRYRALLAPALDV